LSYKISDLRPQIFGRYKNSKTVFAQKAKINNKPCENAIFFVIRRTWWEENSFASVPVRFSCG
jgi:hypothetical protein